MARKIGGGEGGRGDSSLQKWRKRVGGGDDSGWEREGKRPKNEGVWGRELHFAVVVMAFAGAATVPTPSIF
jgi:hypothetical protein